MIVKFKIFESVQDEIGFGMGADFANDAGEKFWGNLGAGVLPICKKTGRILVAYRSKYVNEPHTWGIFGGKLDEEDGEDDLQVVAKREFVEETGFSGDVRLIPAYIYKAKGFEYHNFIGILDDEFEPELDWETEKTKWINFDELEKLYPKHFGLKALVQNDLDKIKMYSK